MEKSKERVKKVISLLSKVLCKIVAKRVLCIMLRAFKVDVERICVVLGLSSKSLKKYEAILDLEEYGQLLQIGKHKRAGELDDYRKVIFAELERGTCVTKYRVRCEQTAPSL